MGAPVTEGASDANSASEKLAIVLGGGGARAAYQAGVMRAVSKRLPDLVPSIYLGVSAGAINAAYLAASPDSTHDTTGRMIDLWANLQAEQVIDTRTRSLVSAGARWGFRLVGGGAGAAEHTAGLMDTSPLRSLLWEWLGADADGALSGVQGNLERGRLDAFAVTSTSYTSGQAVTWVQGNNVTPWARPLRRSAQCSMHVDHIMASAALPVVFPAVKVDDEWHGDGGIRLTAPLSPALRLGASKILVISTRRQPGPKPAPHGVTSYPSPAQILGVLLNAIFLDNLDNDAMHLSRINALLDAGSTQLKKENLRRVDIKVIRPSADIGAMAAEHETQLPASFRYMLRGWGTKKASNSDALAMLLFEGAYTSRLIELGERDAEQQMDEILEFLT